ncbi:hypothetical protein VitviT2T_015281 [Vitis vinifera]|uniref:GDSL esterase/lipase n=1 Tax=Vitis vinifera TaxID=29760 RepID=A0ABY9CM41_VITVI|nr:GDSL esterase/lipase At1g29670 isoform X2 [Vitis vinifera]WJZ96613.1 hypothetical protein VitviT2T_015281 [Vitis vinifera]|eukprot:XP_010655594.1 PREDICTED: GDSL esterase/lipase At1g29670 isoform X2 [Vitis vinifera]
MMWRVVPVLLLVFYLQHCAHGEPEVPCYFIFGDSLSDSGNNNKLVTLGRANFPPNGIDFPNGPTGRFCNGRTIVDVLAELLKLEDYIPPYATVSDYRILQGANFASGSSGIRDETGRHYGDLITMKEQLKNYQIAVSRITNILGNDTAAMDHLSKCLFTVGIGSHDYINNYYLPQLYPTNSEYTPVQYASVLINQYFQQLKTLYKHGARKVAIFGLGRLGCMPLEVGLYGEVSDTECVEFINDAVQVFNDRLVRLVDGLNANLTDAHFAYINMSGIQSFDAAAFGFRVRNNGCCGGQLPCLPFSGPCSNRTEHIYWDFINPTEAANMIYAQRAYISETPSDAHPMDIHTLAQFASGEEDDS